MRGELEVLTFEDQEFHPVPETYYIQLATNINSLERLCIEDADWENSRKKFAFANLLQKNRKSLKFIRFQRWDPDHDFSYIMNPPAPKVNFTISNSYLLYNITAMYFASSLIFEL